MNELIEKHFDEYTINISKNRLLIKPDSKGRWIHYQLRLEADETPDVCVPNIIKDGSCEGCGNDYAFEAYCQCWLCDNINLDGSLRPRILMYADRIDDPNESYCLNDEFAGWMGEIIRITEEAKKEYPKVEAHGVRHGDSDWTIGIELTHEEFAVNRVGWVLSIPKPDPMQTALTDDAFLTHGL
jgi:hypothetical protein